MGVRLFSPRLGTRAGSSQRSGFRAGQEAAAVVLVAAAGYMVLALGSLETLEGLDSLLSLPPDEVRILRVLEVVEAIGNEEARALCRRWSDGATGELLTEEARTALARLSRGR